MRNLLEHLNLIPPDRVLLDDINDIVNAGELINRVQGFQESYFLSLSRGASVAIQVIDIKTFVLALIALDGHVKQLMILPEELQGETKTELLNRANIDYLFDGKELINLNKINLDKADTEEIHDDQRTRWILTTSGTTGTPKLIVHTLASLTGTTQTNIEKGGLFCWGLTYDPARFAGIQVILQVLLSGSRLVITKSQNPFDGTLDVFVKGKVNALSATPSWWRKLLMSEIAESLHLTRITLGGEIADQTLLTQLKKCYPEAKITHVYASTEAGVGFSVKDGRAGFPAGWLDNNTMGIQLKVSAENHLLIKPKVIATGKEIDSRLSNEGYLDTEDMVEILGGRVLFKGRASGAINIGGNKVNPEEVEAVIRQVSGVQEVVIKGKENPIMGQIIIAEVLLEKKPSSTDEKKAAKEKIYAVCKSKLATYKLPAVIKFVESFAYNSTGKLQRD